MKVCPYRIVSVLDGVSRTCPADGSVSACVCEITKPNIVAMTLLTRRKKKIVRRVKEYISQHPSLLSQQQCIPPVARLLLANGHPAALPSLHRATALSTRRLAGTFHPRRVKRLLAAMPVCCSLRRTQHCAWFDQRRLRSHNRPLHAQRHRLPP